MREKTRTRPAAEENALPSPVTAATADEMCPSTRPITGSRPAGTVRADPHEPLDADSWDRIVVPAAIPTVRGRSRRGPPANGSDTGPALRRK
jgi:hypothetical protein